ncbi:unnamed protein product [Closterium sp. NIES-64]|nr:unnamed protein product [Closterium sp. NIES-64]
MLRRTHDGRNAQWPHREEQWQADGRGAASAFSSCLKPLAAADNTWCGPPFALLYFITLACMRPFHNGDSPTHCLSLPSPPAPSPPFLSLSLRSTTPSQELKSSAAGTRTGRRGGGLPLREAAGGGGEGCGVYTDASPRSSPVAMQGLVGGGGRQQCCSAGGSTRNSPQTLPITGKALPQVKPISSTPSQELRCWSSETPCHACCPRCFNCLLLSRHQLRTRTGRRGGGLPLREAAGGAAAALISSSHVSGGEGRWGLHRRFPTLLPCGHAGTHGDGREAALSLAMQQRQLTGPVAAASAAGSTGGGEGRWGQHQHFPTPLPGGRAGTRGDGREAALQQMAIAATRESIGVGSASQAPWLDHSGVPPSLNPPLPTSQQPRASWHCTALVGSGLSAAPSAGGWAGKLWWVFGVKWCGAVKVGRGLLLVVYDSVVYDGVVYDSVVYDSVVYDSVVYDTVVYDSVVYDSVVYDTVVYDSVVYDGVVYDGVLYDSVAYDSECGMGHWHIMAWYPTSWHAAIWNVRKGMAAYYGMLLLWIP